MLEENLLLECLRDGVGFLVGQEDVDVPSGCPIRDVQYVAHAIDFDKRTNEVNAQSLPLLAEDLVQWLASVGPHEIRGSTTSLTVSEVLFDVLGDARPVAAFTYGKLSGVVANVSRRWMVVE